MSDDPCAHWKSADRADRAPRRGLVRPSGLALIRCGWPRRRRRLPRDIRDHFKYGSIGAEEGSGIPYWIWRVLPIVFEDKLPKRPGDGYERIGFLRTARRTAARSARRSVRAAAIASASTAPRVMSARSATRPTARAASCSACPRIRWICRPTRAS